MTRTFTPRHRSVLVDLFSRNVIRQSLVWTSNPWRDRGPRALCRPRFSFFNIQLSKNGHRRRGVMGLSLLALGPVECRSRGSLDFVQRMRNTEANFFLASSVAAVVGEAYIVGGPPKCQHRFRSFLNFLRRSFGPRRFRPFSLAARPISVTQRYLQTPASLRSYLYGA